MKKTRKNSKEVRKREAPISKKMLICPEKNKKDQM